MGKWPQAESGAIADAPGETWLAVDMALRNGRRGMPGGSSLAILLADKRQLRNLWTRPALSESQVLAWADAHHQRTGKWPNVNSGPVTEASEENWANVNHVLKDGRRSLPGGCSLAELLAVERGARNRACQSPLTRRIIIQWAVAFHRRTGRWPTKESGPVPEMSSDTWQSIDYALRRGLRGLRGGSSLARLLHEYGKKRNRLGMPPLSYKKILAWADRYRQSTGHWPNSNSGPVLDAPGERWDLIDGALRGGYRGLPGGSSLIALLSRKRLNRNSPTTDLPL